MRTLLIAAVTLAPVVALAQDAAPPPAATGNAVADAFLAIIDTAYDGVTVGSARDEGGATILTDVSGSLAGGGSLSMDSVRIENGRVQPDEVGGAVDTLGADTIAYGTVAIAEPDGSTVSIAAMTLTGAILGTSVPGPSVLTGTEFATAAAETIAVVNDQGQETTIKSANATLTPQGAGKSLDFTFTDLAADTAAFGEGAAQLEALGYDRFVADMAVNGAWDPSNGALDVRNVSLSADEVGTLELMLGADGLTEATMTQIGAANGDFAAILGATQAINVKNLSIRYSDAGLVPRLLDKTAADAGTDRAAIVEGAVTQVSAGLAALDSPAFATEVSAAVRSFLETPGTLTVSAAPATALPLAQVIGGAMMAPQSLPSLLNLKVTAQP